MLSCVFAARQWGHLWTNTMVLFGTDNITTRAALHKKTSRSPIIMAAVRELFTLSVIYSFDFDAYYVPGIYNTLPDAISRLNEPGQLWRLIDTLYLYNFDPTILLPYSNHMSANAFIMSVFPQITMLALWR